MFNRAIMRVSLVTLTSFSPENNLSFGSDDPVIIYARVSTGIVAIKSIIKLFLMQFYATSLQLKTSSPVSKFIYVVLNETKMSNKKNKSIKLSIATKAAFYKNLGQNEIYNGINKQLQTVNIIITLIIRHNKALWFFILLFKRQLDINLLTMQLLHYKLFLYMFCP